MTTRNQNILCGDEFDELCDILNREYGINPRETDASIIDRKLRRYYEKHGLSSLAELLEFIRADQVLLGELGDFIYSQSTHFNRQPEDFKFLVETALKLNRERPSAASGPMHVRCLGCSTGQEAYSIAIYLIEYVFIERESWSRFNVAASDCSLASVQKAREGEYPLEDIRGLDPIPYDNYFTPGSRQGQFVVKPDLHKRVTFNRFNLVTSEYDRDRSADYVFLRNAINFHTPESRASILKRIQLTLKDGGYLILGADPSVGQLKMSDYGYESIGAGRYRAVIP